MEEELQKVRNIYSSHIRMLEKKREEKMEVFKKAESEVQVLVKELMEIKQDIQVNNEECINEFSSKEFKEIMD